MTLNVSDRFDAEAAWAGLHESVRTAIGAAVLNSLAASAVVEHAAEIGDPLLTRVGLAAEARTERALDGVLGEVSIVVLAGLTREGDPRIPAILGMVCAVCGCSESTPARAAAAGRGPTCAPPATEASMARPKPTMDHPTLSGACAALAREGLTSAEIGQRLGIASTTASSLTAYRLGKEGINRRPKPGPLARRRRERIGKQRTVLVDHDVLDAFADHAARRGIGVNELVRRLLGVIADDRAILDNVLDDADELPPQPQPRAQPQQAQA